MDKEELLDILNDAMTVGQLISKLEKFDKNMIVINARDKKYLPTHHKIEPTTTNGLKVPSTALAEQILTISKQCIRKIIGIVDDTQLESINNIIKESVGIF